MYCSNNCLQPDIRIKDPLSAHIATRTYCHTANRSARLSLQPMLADPVHVRSSKKGGTGSELKQIAYLYIFLKENTK